MFGTSSSPALLRQRGRIGRTGRFGDLDRRWRPRNRTSVLAAAGVDATRETRPDGVPALVRPQDRAAEARHAPDPAASAEGPGRRQIRRTGGQTGARASARQRRNGIGRRIVGVRATVAILSSDVDAPSRPARRSPRSATEPSRPHAGRLWGRPERAMQRAATSRLQFGRDSAEAFGPAVTDRVRPGTTNRRGAVLEKVTQAHGSNELRGVATPREATDSSVEEGPEADLVEGGPAARQRAGGTPGAR